MRILLHIHSIDIVHVDAMGEIQISYTEKINIFYDFFLAFL